MSLGNTNRKVPRLRRHLEFLLPDGWKGEVVDLSLTGMRIQSVVELHRLTSVEGELVLPSGRKLAVRGRVIWSTPPDHLAFIPAELGLELSEVSEEYAAAVAELFASEG